MAVNIKSPIHEAAVFAAAALYFDYGMYCWTAIDPSRNNASKDPLIDIVVDYQGDIQTTWGIVVATDMSIVGTMVHLRWAQYAQAFTHCCLIVPVDWETYVAHWVRQYRLTNCVIATWQKKEDMTFCFNGLPGLPPGEHDKRSGYYQVIRRKPSNCSDEQRRGS